MVVLIVNTVNRLYSYIKIFCLQNYTALYIAQRKAINNLGFQLHTHTHPLVLQHFAQAKLNLLFGQFIVVRWVLWLCWVELCSGWLSRRLLSYLLRFRCSWVHHTVCRATSRAMSNGRKQCGTNRATHFTFLNQDYVCITFSHLADAFSQNDLQAKKAKSEKRQDWI